MVLQSSWNQLIYSLAILAKKTPFAFVVVIFNKRIIVGTHFKNKKKRSNNLVRES